MYLCSDNHDEICHENGECPACRVIGSLEEERDGLVKEKEDLVETIDSLRESLEELRDTLVDLKGAE